jgi:flavorubredoxin
VITTFVGLGKMALMQLPVNRIRLLNPGEHLKVVGHDLEVVHPPTFDAPESTSLFDHATRVLFSTDTFGALLKTPSENASKIPSEQLNASLRAWVTIDTPWIHKTDSLSVLESLKEIQKRSPEQILSSHLPSAPGSMLDTFIEQIGQARKMDPFVGPAQKDIEKMMQ